MLNVRSQMQRFGGEIDDHPVIHAKVIVESYDAVAGAPTFDVSQCNEVVQWAYNSYRQAIGVFSEGTSGLTEHARHYLSGESSKTQVPFEQWGMARSKVNEALELLHSPIQELE